jgi:hypothetical protein
MEVPGVQFGLGDITRLAVTVGAAFIMVRFTVTVTGVRGVLSISIPAE